MKNFARIAGIIIPPFTSLGTAWQLIETRATCFLLLALALVILGIGIYMIRIKEEEKTRKEDEEGKKVRQMGYVFLFCGVLLVVFFVVGLIRNKNQNIMDRVFDSYIQNRWAVLDGRQKEEEEMDVHTMYETAKQYMDARDFKRGRELAQKAAEKGNGAAFSILSVSDIHGLGCTINPEGAVSNMMSFMKHQFIYSFEVEKSILDVLEHDEMRKAEFEECFRQQSYIMGLYGQVQNLDKFHTKNRALEVIEKNHAELERLSALGYTPASELLYVRAASSDLIVADVFKKPARSLYYGDHVSTNPKTRYELLTSLSGNSYYDRGKYDEHIRDNYYYDLVHEEDVMDGSYFDGLDDETLFNEYRQAREQYNWCGKLFYYPDYRVHYLLLDDMVDYNHYFQLSKAELDLVMDKVRERMPQLPPI